MPDGKLKLKAESVRGYSAYEIAVQKGYIGTEEEWLASLHGDGVTVNGKGIDALGDIKINSVDVPYDGGMTTVKDKIDGLDGGFDELSQEVDDLTADVGNKLGTDKVYNGLDKAEAGFALDARQGVELADRIDEKADATALTALQTVVDGKASVKTLALSLSVAGWGGGTTQSITASGVETGSIVIVTPSPSSYVAYGNATIRCTAQSTNSLTFTCSTTPTAAIGVNVLILTAGGN